MSSKPPMSRYKLTLEITGNTMDEVLRELAVQSNDADHELGGDIHRHNAEWISGRSTLSLVERNPGMTPEKYAAELDAWRESRRGDPR